MGILTDVVEAEAYGHHFAIRAVATLTGGAFSLYVDGKKVDWMRASYFRGPKTLAAVVGGELLTAQVTLKLTGCRYRLFLGDEELLLRVEAGESSAFIEFARPMLLTSGSRSIRTLTP